LSSTRQRREIAHVNCCAVAFLIWKWLCSAKSAYHPSPPPSVRQTFLQCWKRKRLIIVWQNPPATTTKAKANKNNNNNNKARDFFYRHI
jgi:hypothetical protein